MTFRSMLIVDGTLTGLVGHHFEYARSVADETERRGISVDVACGINVEQDVRKALRCVPTFREGVYDEYIHSHRFPRLAAWISAVVSVGRFLRDWRRAGFMHRLGSETLLFVPNATEVSIIGLIVWLRRLPAGRRPHTNLLFRYEPRKELVRLIGWMLRPLAAAGHLTLTTDSDVLAKDYGELMGIPMEVLPIPHITPALLESRHTHLQGTPVKLVFLGNARLEKGIDLLGVAIGMLDEDILNGTVSFEIQCNVFLKVEDAPAAVRRLDDLHAAYGEAITLLKNPLSTSEYYGLLSRADAVVIPYRKENYRARTSGILIEAIAAGKPVIAPKDTWMAGQVDDGNGAVLFESGNASDLADAIRRIAKEFESMQSGATARRKRFIGRHNAAALCDQILAPALHVGTQQRADG
jgi:glycosyltransferase involved in cell wall biosynthesis